MTEGPRVPSPRPTRRLQLARGSPNAKSRPRMAGTFPIRGCTPGIERCLLTSVDLFSPLGLCSVRRGYAKAGQPIEEGVLESLDGISRGTTV